ncbi:hypothetical protein M91_21684 [Bos mutus]|uniref:Peptidase S1 domain-containing protein n=1 Tax=Bos mutus TaxID=72004 RepID=L8HLI9_9CETA|nr:hypothetical protein M91_21684 [Bos mutus]
MGGEAGIPQGLGQPAALLWLLLLNVATLELRGSPATAAPGPTAGVRQESGSVSPRCHVVWTHLRSQLLLSVPLFPGRVMVTGMHVGSCGAKLHKGEEIQSPVELRGLLGSTQLSQHTQHTREVSVSQIITHPDFEKLHPFGSGIAILQLLFPVNFTSYIIPACLPVPGMKLSSNSSCWIPGWGMLTEETPLLERFHLQEGKVSFLENKFYKLLYVDGRGKNCAVHMDMLCAGDFSTGKSICRFWVLMGLASWGFDCRHPIYPSIFTNVTNWMDEIQRLTPLPEPTSALLHRPSFHNSLLAGTFPPPVVPS